MKRTQVSDLIFWTLWIFTALCVTAGYGLIREQEALARDVAGYLDRAEQALSAGDWAAFEQAVAQARTAWEDARPWLSFFTDHDPVHEISDTLLEAQALARAQDPAAWGPLLVARERILILPERERLLMRNLF
ncbi:MAG TPA: DUF4363 family protein [Limnochordales bacterium]